MLRPFLYRNNLLILLLLALVYYLLQVYLFNFALINHTLLGTFPLLYKLTLFSQLISGHIGMFPLTQGLFLIMTSVLVGANLMLLLLRLQKARQLGRLKVSVGGTSLLAVFSSGCPSCGLTVFSFLGPSSSVASSLLRNDFLQLGILGLLTLSVFLSLQSLQKITCKVLPVGQKAN